MMSAPSGEDAMRALLAERAPGYSMVQPRLDRAVVAIVPEIGLVMVDQHDSANGVTHSFAWQAREDFTLTDMLTTAARVIHAPLN